MNHRIFIEKKPNFDIEATSLLHELNEAFSLNLATLRILNIYDIFNIETNKLEAIIQKILADPISDIIYKNQDELFNSSGIKQGSLFSFEYLSGQFDQRADSAMQCCQLLDNQLQKIDIKTGKLLILPKLDDLTLKKITNYCINPVEMQLKDLSILTLPELSQPDLVPILHHFISISPTELQRFKEKYRLAMRDEDLHFIQHYFQTLKRDPSETELKVLDIYWSDHCRHTTFETELQQQKFPATPFGERIKKTFNHYLTTRQSYYQDKISAKPITLMDLATLPAKYLRQQGKLPDVEISEEINACSLFIDVDVQNNSINKSEKWLLQFKNETHNHPTEIEPYGGASTCIGGAIRDPLSGRAYVYQAIRVTGAGNPKAPLDATLAGKLPQKKITTQAAHGYSAYGNQIGLATSMVAEIYHEGYTAKRMEIGAVIGAVPYANIQRIEPVAGDIVVLIGGLTGRDGCGGASGSSKAHTLESVQTCAAEVQKGNAPVERKIQRLFLNPAASKLIKKCNDFGAGGVCVAVGELARGLEINLDAIPTKYSGLNGTELAISESQERMAIVLAAEDVAAFSALAKAENLSAVSIAIVTADERLIMRWQNQIIVDIERNFLDSNGAAIIQACVEVSEPQSCKLLRARMNASENHTQYNAQNSYLNNNLSKNLNSDLNNNQPFNLYEHVKQLNHCAQKGLNDRFDSSVGAGTVLLPFGGKYQLTPADASVHKLPVNGETDSASAISWGFNPELSTASPFHGAAWAVIESTARLVATGANWQNIHYTFQEYFKRLGDDPKNWGQPFAALLGAYDSLMQLERAAIGGKDSMSGSFHDHENNQDLHVPPTLVSFAVAQVQASKVISPEFKRLGSKLYYLQCPYSADADKNLPNITEFKKIATWLYQQIQVDNILSAKSIRHEGLIQTLAQSCFGNHIGAKISCSPHNFTGAQYDSFVIEVAPDIALDLNHPHLQLLGETIAEYNLQVNEITYDLSKVEANWLSGLEDVFPLYSSPKQANDLLKTQSASTIKSINKAPSILKNKVAKPRVLLPVFVGMNSEIDTRRAFEKAGAIVEELVFCNQNSAQIHDSIQCLSAAIKRCEIITICGGFSAGDEPDGSGKFIATVLNNPEIKNAIQEFLQKDHLILGICNGFQALIKTGLVPFGDIKSLSVHDATLATNNNNRHVARVFSTKITNTNSPWFQNFKVGDVHQIAISHGEGRIIASEVALQNLSNEGLIAAQYVDFAGNPSMNPAFNPNGSALAIEGLFSKDGKVLGKMGHPERQGTNIFKNYPDIVFQDLFKSGVGAFK